MFNSIIEIIAIFIALQTLLFGVGNSSNICTNVVLKTTYHPVFVVWKKDINKPNDCSTDS